MVNFGDGHKTSISQMSWHTTNLAPERIHTQRVNPEHYRTFDNFILYLHYSSKTNNVILSSIITATYKLVPLGGMGHVTTTKSPFKLVTKPFEVILCIS